MPKGVYERGGKKEVKKAAKSKKGVVKKDKKK